MARQVELNWKEEYCDSYHLKTIQQWWGLSTQTVNGTGLEC